MKAGWRRAPLDDLSDDTIEIVAQGRLATETLGFSPTPARVRSDLNLRRNAVRGLQNRVAVDGGGIGIFRAPGDEVLAMVVSVQNTEHTTTVSCRAIVSEIGVAPVISQIRQQVGGSMAAVPATIPINFTLPTLIPEPFQEWSSGMIVNPDRFLDLADVALVSPMILDTNVVRIRGESR